ncbi:putative ccch zinc finger domain-containing protein [Rosellinia necatrix]|uniref:Putative ccch zinc finger domain-containing protein n=1 Tax=Rosellinia necatrix TaxID=77044 RepID=A0A1W2TQK9_ROSNE|nr:putative ccch zinc finger domain-containing protein [Rosellinia necatrix]
MAPLCRFYQPGQPGSCRNGDSCRFEHPGANNNPNPFGANRFNALNTTSTRPQDGTLPYRLTKESIKIDLADERPAWILSCYGPGKEAPEQLFGGYPREQSLEEVMLHIRTSADQQQALSEVMALYNQAGQQIQTTLGNLDGAVRFLISAENNHPNRIDICKQNTIEGGTTGVFAVRTDQAGNSLNSNAGANQNPFSTTQSNAFGGGGAPAFGQPSVIGQKPNPFGATQSSQFGQPSQMGAAAPAFGQPSQMGASAPAFGQPSQMGASAPAFGQPSAMGQRQNPFSAASAAAPSAFAQVGQPAFGQPSALGQTANPFGAPAASSANPFGQQSSAPSGASPFAQVGQPTNSTASPFGQPATSNPFAQAATSTELSMDTSVSEPALNNPFNQKHSPPFGTISGAFGNTSANPFGAGAPPNQSTNQPTNQPPNQPSQAATATSAKAGPFAPGSAKQHPPAESYITKAINGQLATFGGVPVVYRWKVNDRYQDATPENPSVDQYTPGIRKQDGTWCKLLFPGGPPAYNKDTEPDAQDYNDTIKAVYARVTATGQFQGDMPEVPPMREDCIWTF